VSEYQPSRGEKRGTLTFERSSFHAERQASFDGKHGGQFRSTDSGIRQGREDRNRESRGKDRGENYTKKDDRISTGKLPGAQDTLEAVSGTFTSTSDHEPVRTNAWSQPLRGSRQSAKPTQSDEVPNVTQWNADSEAPLDSASFQPECSDLLRTDSAGNQEKPEIESRLVESQANEREPGKRTGYRIDGSQQDYRGDRGRRQSRRGRRQNWPDQAELGENMPRYGRRSQPRTNKEGRSQRAEDDAGRELEETAAREEHNQTERRRTMRYGSGGRGLYQSGHGEYSTRSRGRGMLNVTYHLPFLDEILMAVALCACT